MTTFVDDSRSDFNFASEPARSPVPEKKADILWRDAAGDNVVWIMNNSTPDTVATLRTVPPDWHVKATADFSVGGFGDSDILWQNDNGALALWQMDGEQVSAINALPNPGPTSHVVGDNDFNGDFSDDILLQDDNGALEIWTGINPATGTVSDISFVTQNPGPTWHVVGTGDTDDDQRAGILWQNDNGALALWENPIFFNVPLPGGILASFVTFATVAALPTVDASWHVKGMADINGDGASDVVFQNDNGAVVVWEMGAPFGTTINAANLINLNPGPAWHVVGLRDMDGDLKADILFQNDNGAAAVWEDYASAGPGVGLATFLTVLPIDPNPNPNGHVWDLV